MPFKIFLLGILIENPFWTILKILSRSKNIIIN